MKKANKKALAWADKLEREAEEEWARAHGRGTSKLPAHVRHRHVDNYHQRMFAADQFRAFAKAEMEDA